MVEVSLILCACQQMDPPHVIHGAHELRPEVLPGNQHLWPHMQTAAQFARFGPVPLATNVRRVRPRSSEPSGGGSADRRFLEQTPVPFEVMLQAQAVAMSEQVNMLQQALANQSNALMQFLQTQQIQMQSSIPAAAAVAAANVAAANATANVAVPPGLGRPEAKYQDPHTLLNEVDPAIKNIMVIWQKTFRRNVKVYLTQQELADKYAKVDQAGEILRAFSDEAKRVWQWTNQYKAKAQLITEAGEDPHDVDVDFESTESGVYSIEKAFAKLRKRHAKECQTFIIAHQKRSTELAYEAIQPQQALKDLIDEIESWLLKHPELLSEAAKNHTRATAKRFVELTMRQAIPQMKSRMQAEKDKAQKKEAEHISAQERFDSLDIKPLIAMALLEVVNKSQGKFKTGGVVEFLFKENPEIKKEYEKLSKERHKSKAKSNLKGRGRSPAKGSKELRKHSRSNSSRRSNKSSISHSSRSISRSSRASHASRSSRSPRQKSRSNSRASSRSKFSGSKKHVTIVDELDKRKGKGKGKGKGKNKHKSKRSGTPRRSSSRRSSSGRS